MLGYSGIAQGGYMLVGLLVGLEIGINALFFYLAAYALMNLAAFGVIAVRQRETPFGDDISSVEGLAKDRPSLAWPLTISMLALAGLPGTAGFFGKVYLVEAAVAGDYTWLGVLIAIGSMISLSYYLRVVAAVWMSPKPKLMPAMAGASQEADPDAGGYGSARASSSRVSRSAAAAAGAAAGSSSACSRSARSARSASASTPTPSPTSPRTQARRSPRSSSGSGVLDAAPDRTRTGLMWLRDTAPVACTLMLGQRTPSVSGSSKGPDRRSA